MQVLKRIAVTVLILLLLGYIKWWFDKSNAVYADFVRNLVANIQFALLLVVVMVTSIQWFARYRFRRKVSTAKLAIFVLIFLLALEAVAGALLRRLNLAPGFLQTPMGEYYGFYGCNQAQFDPACARYDDSLSYTLLPRREFRFANYEFDNKYQTNRLGLRDNDSALVKPEVICLGDSHSMGWGVEQDQTYSSRLQKLSGLKTLNAGISSYGTAREILSLKRMDTSGLKYIVIQYCRNDTLENWSFIDEGYRLPIMTKARYDSLTQSLQWRIKYYPLRHVLTITRLAISGNLKRLRDREKINSAPFIDRNRQASMFRDIINHSRDIPSSTRIIVVNVSGPDTSERQFVQNLQKQVLSAGEDKRIIVLDVLTVLNKTDFYPLDGHLNASGHAKLAGMINDAIKNNLQQHVIAHH